MVVRKRKLTVVDMEWQVIKGRANFRNVHRGLVVYFLIRVIWTKFLLRVTTRFEYYDNVTNISH